MNTNVIDAVKIVRAMLTELDGIADVEKVICPPFVSLSSIKESVRDKSIKLGAQNMYFEERGAYTGEISPLMLVDLCDFVILGHSERRKYFFENDEIINKKVRAAIEAGLMPILCVGESLEDNEAGRTEKIIAGQVQAGLSGINPNSKLVLAYEPVWAIGTGRAATGEQANATIASIRNIVSDLWNTRVAQEIRILYGGSVTGANIAEFVVKSDIDGALVGGASLEANDFLSIVRQTAALKVSR